MPSYVHAGPTTGLALDSYVRPFPTIYAPKPQAEIAATPLAHSDSPMPLRPARFLPGKKNSPWLAKSP